MNAQNRQAKLAADAAADRAYNEDLMRLRGHAGQQPGRRVGAETPRSTKLALWGGIGALVAGATFGIFGPHGSIDRDDPLNGGGAPQEKVVNVGVAHDEQLTSPTSIHKVQPGDTISEIGHAAQLSGRYEPGTRLDQIEDRIKAANPAEFTSTLPAGADLVVPVDNTLPEDAQPAQPQQEQ